MEIATLILMLAPFVFAAAYYGFPHADTSETLTWLLAICTFACFVWGFFIRRKHPSRAWARVVIGFVQLLLMSILALKPQKTRGPAPDTVPIFCSNLWYSGRGIRIVVCKSRVSGPAPLSQNVKPRYGAR